MYANSLFQSVEVAQILKQWLYNTMLRVLSRDLITHVSWLDYD